MPVKIISTQAAPDLAHDLEDWNGPLAIAIRPGRACCSTGQRSGCWFFEGTKFLTDTGIRPRSALTTILTREPEVYFLPPPIPAPVMRRSQKRFEKAVVNAPSLTGHQRLELHQEINDTGTSQVQVTHSAARGRVDTPAIWRQTSRGKSITAELREELTAFDVQLASYDPSIGECPVLGIVGALGWQAGLAKHLSDIDIQASDWGTIAKLISASDPDFLAARDKCERLIEAHGVAFDMIAFMMPVREHCIGAALTRDLHEILFRELQPHDQTGFFRTHDGGFDLETGLVGLPHRAIAEQMRLFTGRFGYMTWPDSHPIVRAGLALLQFLRIRPFAEGNGDVGRLLLSLFLQDRGIPELPLDLVLARRMPDYRDRVRAALIDGDFVGFIHFLIEVCQEAMAIGSELALEVCATVLQLRHAMAQMGTVTVDRIYLAVTLCSRLIVADDDVILTCGADPSTAIDVARALARLGLIDEIEVGGKFFWSAPGIRHALLGET
ncbi:MAG TPA: Fic family protein [Dongiaceae bacterium]|nr:Fic family protein [Dongiaceae bacterium]